MSYFGLSDVNSVNTLFSSLNNGVSKNGATGFGSSILADYASIRSGSYRKLLNAYYDKTGSSAVTDMVGSSSSTSTSTAKDSAKKLTRIENAAESLKESTDALITRGTSNVFKQVTVTGEDGTTSTGYQKEEIYKRVNSFVEDYNTVIEATEESNTASIGRDSAQMVRLTNTNEKVLESIGITINKDDTLTIDKETFMKADMEKVKTLFNGTGSYGYNIGVKTSMIDYHAQNEASKANTYSSKGSYNYNYMYGGNYSNYI